MEGWGYPERVSGGGTSVVPTRTFRAGCVCDCGSLFRSSVLRLRPLEPLYLFKGGRGVNVLELLERRTL